MKPDEVAAVIEVMDAYWPGDRAEGEFAAWWKDLAPMEVNEALDVLETIHQTDEFRPSWARFRAVHKANSRRGAPPAISGPRCDCDGGYRWVQGRHNAVIPCERCKPGQHQAWKDRAYEPVIYKSHDDLPVADVMTAQAWLVKLRAQLAAAKGPRR